MDIVAHDQPFRHWVIDDIAAANDLCSVMSELPRPEWPGWVRYSSAWERDKRTTRDPSVMPWSLLGKLTSPQFVAGLSEMSGIAELIPDPFWHGSGLHVMDPGGHLGCHIDYARHPAAPWLERRLSLILFCNHAGGELQLWNNAASEVAASYPPLPGRAVVFTNEDWSYHSVSANASGLQRVTLAAYYCSPIRPGVTRQRALWCPQRENVPRQPQGNS